MLKVNLLKGKKIVVVGLGYVGMPLAIEFAKKYSVIGFDTNEDKINSYLNGIDVTNEVGNETIKRSSVIFTSEESMLDNDVAVYIVAVPTPIRRDKAPDLSPIINATKIVARHLSRGAIVIYESTVYPGVTEDVCIPILESGSKLKVVDDFGVGYSPERINPGDTVHRLRTIKKIVSGINDYYLSEISYLYSSIIEAGIFPVSSIKIAEAAKVCENSQRDVNIAFVNELAMAFSKMGINTNEVIDAMNTKWNALGFRPGLVGGHCIGVDPYYFIFEAEKLGYHSEIISSSRLINEKMIDFVVEGIIRSMIMQGIQIKDCKVAVLGITFKENCPDTRNSKAIEIVNRLKEYGINVICSDSYANKESTMEETGIELFDLNHIDNCNAVIIAVPHKEYSNMARSDFDKMLTKQKNVIADIKGIFRDYHFSENTRYWTL